MSQRMTDEEIAALSRHTAMLCRTWYAALDRLIAAVLIRSPNLYETHELCIEEFPDISKPPKLIIRERDAL